ncbi:hypothetical protein O181_062519 [Austropuccinia psidii MF-1]|uniref:Uncharacterized protein n=1 Tax=Austropuccinia psidii MF-1 TaxID=1389203 RepID=A0A9Q3I1M4_9BASI|nr:hypothetical protein [Austropuccinia psidii MF-1]
MYGGMPPYACTGSLLFVTHKSLHFSRMPTLHMQILMPVQDPDSVDANPYTCTGSQQFKSLLLPGQALNISNNSSHWCRLPTLHTQIFTLVQVPDNSNNSLYWCRLSTLHMQILTLVKVPNNSDNFLRRLMLLTLHTQILTPVQVPDNSDSSLFQGSLPTI